MADLNPNDYNIRWYHKRLPDAIKTNEGRINKRDDIYWTIIREEKIANPTLSDYVSSVSDKVDDIVSDIDMNESDDVMDINPLTIEPPEALIEDN